MSSLAPGAHVGPYEVTGALGAGGMGEVYRARDTKLNRDVAIKVLPAEFATDTERVARFKREAQVLASLNHPNIAGIYGLEEIAGIASSASLGGLLAMTGGATTARYVPGDASKSGHDSRAAGFLVYIKGGTLFGTRFDLGRLEVVGQTVPLLDTVASNPGSGTAQWTMASDGTVVYVPGRAPSREREMDWATRDGKTSVLRAAKADWASPRFSPDGRKLAMEIGDGKQRDIWVYDLSRETNTQLTFDPANDSTPVWTPDGKRIVFGSDRAKKEIRNIYMINADGTGEVVRLTESPHDQVPERWHPDGNVLLFNQMTETTTGWDLMALTMEGDAAHGLSPGKPTVFLATPATEAYPMFSPDGRFVAYMSLEFGSTPHIFVRPFPGPGGPWRVSTNGGTYPRWSASTKELLFFYGSQILFVPYSVVGDSFQADEPRLWTPVGALYWGAAYPYDIHPDGKRVVIAPTANDAGVIHDKVVFMSNFIDFLNQKVPRKQ